MYSIIGDNLPFKTHYESLIYLCDCGFKIPEIFYKFKSIYNIFDFIKKWNNIKKNIKYDVDGLVIKVNNLLNQKILGFTHKYPSWAIAYKFSSDHLSTKIISIKYQVSKHGKICPIAILEPVFLNGSIIEKATLHNKKHIEYILDLHYQDTVVIEKSGEIIPKILRVDKNKRNSSFKKIKFINNCPSCHKKLFVKNHDFFCKNTESCSSQLISKICHFVGKKGMNIKYLGCNIIKNLFYSKKIFFPIDLYKINKFDIIGVKNINNKLAEKIIKSIYNSKKQSFENVLYALAIPNLGEFLCKKIVMNFKNIDIIVRLTKQDLICINGIGVKIADSIIKYFSNKKHIINIKKLQKLGLNFDYKQNNDFTTNQKPLKNLNFVFSGKLKLLTRKRAAYFIKKNGGNVFTSINQKVDFLILGLNPGSKLDKAVNIKSIKILNENEFMTQIFNLKF